MIPTISLTGEVDAIIDYHRGTIGVELELLPTHYGASVAVTHVGNNIGFRLYTPELRRLYEWLKDWDERGCFGPKESKSNVLEPQSR